MRLEFNKTPALVFVQEKMGDGFKLYVDGEPVEGLKAVRIDAAVGAVTECQMTVIPGVRQTVQEIEE